MCFRSPFSVYKCGKCPECLQDLRREWSIRLQLHAMYSGQKPYIAHLTYNDEHLPMNGNVSTLRKKDLQDFIKRLRYYVLENISYYACGEYGDNSTFRPHYHIILFGLSETLSQDEANLLLQKAWKNGYVRRRSQWVQCYAQLHYVTKYVINFFEYNYKDRLAPFRLCSKAFGKDFIKYATENNLYHTEIQNLFHPVLKEKFIPCSSSLNGKRKIVYPVAFIGEQPYWHEESTNNIVFNPKLVNFRDFIEINEFVNGKQKTYRFPLPRYFSNRLYTEDFRYTLAAFKDMQAKVKFQEYKNEYGEYDNSSDVPMWKQQKLYRWEHKKKNYKDKKNFKNPKDLLTS